jgi:ribose 5-phosphate isomerase A
MQKIDRYKKLAAETAVEFIRDGMIIGLGTGSTTAYALKKISENLQMGKVKNISGIPSSKKTERLAKKLKIPLTNFEQVQSIDIVFDGADEVDTQLNLIKGGGGALLREKIIAQAARRVIIMVDESKISDKLGQKWSVPIEVLPFSWKAEATYLKSLKAKVSLRYSEDKSIYKTDQKNYIIDANFGTIKQPEVLAEKLNQRAGIIEHGLFIDLASDIIVAGKKGINHLKRYNLL